MKKQELLNYIDNELLEKLFGFCYARTNDSYEAQELCSDIIFALIKAANKNGEIENLYSFIWKIARNVYADFSNHRRRSTDLFYSGNAEDILPFLPDAEKADDSDELLAAVYRRIAFLTKAYREVMILFYMDGASVAEIAKCQNISEGAVRQRLFLARKKVKSEVEEMERIDNRPVAFDKIDYVIWGSGTAWWDDPSSVCFRMFSKHIVWLCHKKPMSASEIAEELNVPMVYVEEELEILETGKNGNYGFLRRLNNGKYTLNIILLDKDVIENAQRIYARQIPKVCEIISEYIQKHKEEYLAFPYLNKKVDWNLVLWQQIFRMSHAFSNCVEAELEKKYFSLIEEVKRPFSICGYVYNGTNYGGGWDEVDAENVCGFAKVHLDNIYITRIQKHFDCGLNIANDPQIQLALRAINGLDMDSLSKKEAEHAARAIACGYLYREENTLYTKILVNDIKDKERLFGISDSLEGLFQEGAQAVAKEIAALIRKAVPDYLLGEWKLANWLASMPILDSVVEALIEKGILIPPKDGIGAEGCWMSVSK